MTNSIKKEQGSVNVTIVNNTIKQKKFNMFTEIYPNPITIYKATNYNSIYKTTFITQT